MGEERRSSPVEEEDGLPQSSEPSSRTNDGLQSAGGGGENSSSLPKSKWNLKLCEAEMKKWCRFYVDECSACLRTDMNASSREEISKKLHRLIKRHFLKKSDMVTQ